MSIKKMPVQFFFALAVLIAASTETKSQPGNTVLAKIGNREISVNEFLYRSELSVRPQVFKNKNVTLNNLISEKMLALEASRDRKMLLHPGLQGQIKGIKEQLMREELFQTEAYKKVALDTAEISHAYRQSLREYEVEFYTMRKSEVAQKIKAILDSVPQYTGEVFKGLEESVGKKPLHKIRYLDQEDENIAEALFAKLLDTGTVIGPIKLRSGEYIVMKVTDWTDEILISGVDQHARWNKVTEKLHSAKAGALWMSYANSVMGNRKIRFNEETTSKLAGIAFEYYRNTKETDSLNRSISEIPMPVSAIDVNATFFTVDKTPWTVSDFKKELLSHPLVYRTKELTEENFEQQMQLAVLDMIRDHYLTKEAYKKKLDAVKSIATKVKMWEDAFLAAGKQISVMNSAIERGIVKSGDNAARLEYWGAYLADLQRKHGKSIWINTKSLEKISLTNIDLVAFKPGVPYPAAVPTFPMFTRSDNVDYAVKKNY